MGSVHDAAHICILEDWSSRLIERVAAVTRARASGKNCGLIQMNQSSGNARSLAPSSGSQRSSANTNRVTGSMAAAKPQAKRRQPWTTPLLALFLAYEFSGGILCVVELVYHLEKTAAKSGSVCSMLLSMAHHETLCPRHKESQKNRINFLSGRHKKSFDQSRKQLLLLLCNIARFPFGGEETFRHRTRFSRPHSTLGLLRELQHIQRASSIRRSNLLNSTNDSSDLTFHSSTDPPRGPFAQL